jgi:hypothetical protein
MDRYCLLSDIVDVRGHININLEKTASLLKKRLSTEVIADFGSTDDFGGSATASVLVTRSGHAYGIREDKVRNSSSNDIRLAYEDVKMIVLQIRILIQWMMMTMMKSRMSQKTLG